MTMTTGGLSFLVKSAGILVQIDGSATANDRGPTVERGVVGVTMRSVEVTLRNDASREDQTPDRVAQGRLDILNSRRIWPTRVTAL
jgi:hypothetical protein